MSKLDELIAELCPDGVEYKTLGEVCETITTGRLNANAMVENGKYAFFTCDKEVFKIDTYAFDCEAILVSGNGSQVGHINYYKGKFNAYQRTYVLTDINSVTYGFLLHWLNAYLKPYIIKNCKKGSVPYITLPMLQNFQIPVPPLPVQEEIVRILDKFTSLTAELTAELTARRKQYKYYRDSLLTRETKVEIKKLGDFATITRGGNFQKKDFVESGLPCIHYGQMYTHFGTWTDKTLTYVDKTVFDKSKQAQPNDIVMAVTSENVDDVCKCTAWVGKEPIAVSGHTAIIHHNQNAKYLSYYFQSSRFYKQKVKLAHGTKVIEVTPDKLNDITIPLPPLDIQQRIVNVLDNFDAICSDLNIGLPAEIDARKKQYEYYRDLLLTFAERGNTISSSSAVQQFSSSAVQQFSSSAVQQFSRIEEIRLLQYVFGYAIVRLGEISELYAGATPSTSKSEYWENGTIPWMSSGEVNLGQVYDTEKKITQKGFDNCSTKMIPANTVVVALAGQGKTRGTVAITRIPLCTNQSLCSIVTKDFVDSYFLYFYLKGQYQKLRSISSGDGTRGGLNLKMLREFEIILPAFEEQERIVKILDRFDSLCNDISSGLPAEIEARQKQYEYYRDKLLMFKEK